MSLFNKLKEKNEQIEKFERQRLTNLSEKELMIEIALELKKLNRQGQKIARNQVLWSD